MSPRPAIPPNGLFARDSSVTVRDSVFHGSAGPGISISSFNLPTNVLVERSESSGNATGVSAANAGNSQVMVRLADSVVTGNVTGLSQQTTSNIVSFRTNMVAGNGSDGNPSLSISMK